jgi:hypothetical protein
MYARYLLLLIASVALAETEPATIHVYRQKWHVGLAVKPSVYLDGVALERLHNGSYFVRYIPSGKHMFTAGRSETGLLVDIESGKKYYFRMDHGSLAGPAIILTQIPEAQATSEMRKLKQR